MEIRVVHGRKKETFHTSIAVATTARLSIVLACELSLGWGAAKLMKRWLLCTHFYDRKFMIYFGCASFSLSKSHWVVSDAPANTKHRKSHRCVCKNKQIKRETRWSFSFVFQFFSWLNLLWCKNINSLWWAARFFFLLLGCLLSNIETVKPIKT